MVEEIEGARLGVPPTGRRFEKVDEIYIFQVRNGRLSRTIGVEDNPSRMRQLESMKAVEG